MTRADTDARPARGPVWVAGLLVATAAGVATAHGLYQVAVAARVPTGIAWLYPLITDGLALVAYAATARLADPAGRRYAWTVVVTAAGLSGIAQATWLAGGLTTSGVGAPAPLRFGVGAWPAIAAAVCAHLLHLLSSPTSLFNDQPERLNSRAEQPDELNTAVQPPFNRGGEERSDTDSPTSPDGAAEPTEQPAQHPAVPPRRTRPAGNATSAAGRARAAARGHAARHGHLPTVSELATLADVSRGTAAAVLKRLRGERPGLQLVVSEPEPNPES